MKRFFIVALSIMMILISVPSSYAADDISGHWAENYMRTLVNKGIMEGYGGGIYSPQKSVTRAEFAKLMVESLELGTSTSTSPAPALKDINTGDWFYPWISSAVKSGIIKGYPDSTFQPNKEISRQEMATMLVRALALKEIVLEEATITFKDNAQVNPVFKKDIQRVVSRHLMDGYDDQTFRPAGSATRAETAAVLVRMIDIIQLPKSYRVGNIDGNGNFANAGEFDLYQMAKSSTGSNQIVLEGNRVVYMKSGIVVASPYLNAVTDIYNESSLSGSSRTYVSSGTEMEFLDADEKYVKVQIGNEVGYVKSMDVKLIPSSMSKGRSYFTIGVFENFENEVVLKHHIYNPLTETMTGTVIIGKAPSFMVEGQKYYSWDAVNFYSESGEIVGEIPDDLNFQRYVLRTQTNYTAQQLDQYLTEKYPVSYKQSISESPLVGTGQAYKDMEAKYNVNALYLMAHAIHESAWGTSFIAQTKNNLYGINAVDSDPERMADEYASFQESIERAAEFVSIGYLNPSNWRYNGPFLGHKGAGMNVKYASDPYWGEKIAGHMYRADQYLGGLDSME